MLVEFSVKNFRSIKDKVTLSLAASSEDTHPENTFTDPSGKVRLLKTVAIYGANASGKSNVIKALALMRWLVTASHRLQRGDKITAYPFLLDQEAVEQPTELEIVFITNGSRFVYGFSFDQTRIHEEWLTQADLSMQRVVPRVLFQRELNSDGSYRWTFGEHWKPGNRKLAEDTIGNNLFLARSAQNNHDLASQVFDWIRNRFRGMSSSPESTAEFEFTASMCDKPEVKSRLLAVLRDADLGIEDFSCETYNPKESTKEPDEQNQDVGSNNPKARTIRRIITRHWTTGNESLVDFDLKMDESAGTQRFFSLAGPFIDSMLNGNVIFCDELDSSLHPALTRALIDGVHKHSATPFQFIFTTHDCSLLDADLLRRDQVWFTEKNPSMATELYSLWDIKPRLGENYRKGYLNGRYGAIPFLGEFTF